ncbi:hypothetical protein GQ53DRAFT_740707 [Thozetella sp. PMI_491]|nr:hypothetical protein GQ53DRAFT_740707 [Thozetella sp. PMI_491]
MAADPTNDPSSQNLNLSADEKRFFGQLFRQADSDSVGVVTGEIAVEFFEKTRLDSKVLGEIWQLADSENRGFLTPSGFCLALRLIGHAQAGRSPSAELGLQQGPLPRFDGINPPAAAAPTPPPAALQAQGTGGGPIRIPPLTPEKVNQYASFFERQTLQGDKLSGEQAKQIFEKSNLPNEVLGRIWMLADTEQRGSLVMTEFVIAMHLLYSMKTGALRGLPNIIPAPLYEAAQRRTPGGARQSPADPVSPVSALPRQFTGQGPLAPVPTGSPLGRSVLAPQSSGGWLVTPADKEKFDKIYSELDKTGKGFITGEEAVTFFSSSKLPEETLAQIWDLADMRSEGRLNRDEFAVAMYLIRQQRMKPDGSIPVPSSLPANLIPPSLRTQVRPPTAVSAFDPPPPPPPVVQAQPPPKPPSALDDLFGLDDPLPAAKPQVALATGGSANNDPFASSLSPAPASPIRPTATGSTFKPFVPSSSFGRGLTAQPTGGSNSSASGLSRSMILQPTVEEDLLGDAEHDTSKDLGTDSTELANLSNQIGSLTKQVQDVQGQRSTAQAALNQSNAQKKNFEERLSQLRTMYEKEARDARSLEQQLVVSRAETQKLMGEMVKADGTYQDLQAQYKQVSEALQADQKENADLKERLRVVNAEIAQLRPKIEKLKSEARQQKGLVAINKKQLATTEGERDNLQAESDELIRSQEELSRQASASSPTPQMSSPALSSTSANNPFFRRTGSTDILGTFASPPPKSFTDKSFDDVFGSSLSQSSTPPPPVVAAFKPQTTGTSTASVGSFTTPASGTPNISRQPTLTANAPAPPESRQLTSSHLPLADAVESLSSSRQVSPPASRIDPAESGIATSPAGDAVLSAKAVASSPSAEAPSAPAADSNLTDEGINALFGPAPTEDGNKSAAISPDPFSAMDQAKAKEDFESAFASFKNAKAAQSSAAPGPAAVAVFATEFPPISELEHDDSSDSDSDKGGFDDDFAPASPPPRPTKEAIDSKPLSPTATEPAPKEQTTSDESSPPTAIASSSAFGISSPTDTSTPQADLSASASKTLFDDLDNDFDDLEDAKEGSADDDFANISRSGLDDFNAVFDSPPSSQARSGQTNTQMSFASESAFDIGASSVTISNPADSTAAAPAAASPSKAADPHDWDALFASLDDAPAAPTAGAEGAEGAKDAARPAGLGRALTEEGEHDDPILKNLTSMGYSRKDALSALEKYDYNLERVSSGP